jgi:hypothetical protein
MPPSSGTLVMEAVSTSETSVTFYETTRRNIPEDSHLTNGFFVILRVNSDYFPEQH